MTELMERLIDRLKRLPEEEQDKYAAAYLEELNDDQRWDTLFAETTDAQWKQMASEAREQKKKSDSTTLENLFDGWIFSRDTAGDVHERGPNEPCSAATGRVQNPCCTRSAKSQAIDSPPNRF